MKLYIHFKRFFMNNLNQLLLLIIEKVKKYRNLYEQNEQAVRDQIINPILKKLDWDPENPEEVLPNISIEEGIPDYSLIKNNQRILFIEAKKLGTDIEKKETIKQLAKYSFSEGTKYGVLTNGAIWILIRSFEEGTTLNERVVWKLDLENDEMSSVIRKFTTISQNNIEQIETLVKKIQILDEIWQSMLNEPSEMIKGLIPVFKTLISQGYSDYHFDDTEIEDLLKERLKEIISFQNQENDSFESQFDNEFFTNNPKKMKLKSDSYNLNYSYEILINTANWLIKNGRISAQNIPISISRGNRYLINKEPKHKYGDSFKSPKKLSNGLWIEVHCSTAHAINLAKRLLEKFNFSPDILILD